jgi:hypothetical protein
LARLGRDGRGARCASLGSGVGKGEATDFDGGGKCGNTKKSASVHGRSPK